MADTQERVTLDLARLAAAVARIEQAYSSLHDLVVIEDRTLLESIADGLHGASELVRGAAVDITQEKRPRG